MLPAQLTRYSFGHYPPQAQALAVEHLALLRQLPLAFLPSFLRELIQYDWMFPAERAAVDQQLTFLSTLSSVQLNQCFASFSSLQLSSAQEAIDWVNQPLLFSEQFSAFLWSTGQMESFRTAATAYGHRLDGVITPAPPPFPRLGIAVIGQGATSSTTPLFTKLRPHGTFLTRIDPSDGLDHILAAVQQRASTHPAPYAHWYIEGDTPAAPTPALTTVAYTSLAPAREALLARIQRETAKPGMGPEELRNTIANLSPTELALTGNPILDRFQVQLLTEGSGTQIFATTFAQWATREALRRAAPMTLLVRFAPRQRQRPMNELLSTSKGPIALDPDGSLIDADMAAYYHWINQGRLPGAAQSTFIAWFEGQHQAIVIGPAFPHNTKSQTSLSLKSLLALIQS